jgi:hypothetical protein
VEARHSTAVAALGRPRFKAEEGLRESRALSSHSFFRRSALSPDLRLLRFAEEKKGGTAARRLDGAMRHQLLGMMNARSSRFNQSILNRAAEGDSREPRQ